MLDWHIPTRKPWQRNVTWTLITLITIFERKLIC